MRLDPDTVFGLHVGMSYAYNTTLYCTCISCPAYEYGIPRTCTVLVVVLVPCVHAWAILSTCTRLHLGSVHVCNGRSTKCSALPVQILMTYLNGRCEV
jgi:hypothetical protein